MENKKPLIIVPPMSPPMQKLKEVLEGIAAEENIEIYTVEDAKEFSQLIGSGGQALIMISNAKLAANLLQENKLLIAKNHTKVILLTPKEIPQKTLIKFTKIGLTEAILETSPPKTLLYKVKLLLRSIKITQKEENAPKVVKSMLDMNTTLNSNEEIAQDSQHIGSIDQNSPDESDKQNKKFNAEDGETTLDYLSNLKGKRAATEEAIDTHWKGKKDRNNIESEIEDEGNLKTKNEISDNEIDKYYRGKQKKSSTELEIEPESRPRIKLADEEEETNYGLKNKNKEEDNSEEAEIEKRRKVIYEDDEEEKDFIQKAEDNEIELNLTKDKNNEEEESEEDADLDKKYLIDELMEEKKRNKFQTEDLGGHLTGKVKNEELEPEQEITQENEREEEAESNSIEKKKKRIDESEEDEITQKKARDEEEEQNDSHDGEVDVIDNFMRGDLESTEEIKTRMESNSESKKKKSEELEDEDEELNKRTKLENIDKELTKESKLDLLDGDGEKNKKQLDEEERSGDDTSKRNKLESEEDENNFGTSQISNENEDIDDFDNLKLKTKLEDKDIVDERNRMSIAEDEDENKKRKSNSKLDLEPGKNGLSRDGKTEKISTFYRSGESNKKDQDWNLNDKKKDSTIQLEHGTNESIDINNLRKRHDAGEVTIDYKKLKAEFDLLSRGESTDGVEGVTGYGKNKGLEIEDDSFQVVELGNISLDFAVETINMYNSQEIKPVMIIKSAAEKLMKDEKAYLVAYFYKNAKYSEIYNTYNEFKINIPEQHYSDGISIIKNEFNNELFHSFSMPTWLCREIPEQNSFWRDIELPTWANKELINKKVEFLFPFFDGVERVGHIHLYFPDGINPANDRKIQLIIEMLRGVFLENSAIKRTAKMNDEVLEVTDSKENKGKILNFFGGLFGKKKTG